MGGGRSMRLAVAASVLWVCAGCDGAGGEGPGDAGDAGDGHVPLDPNVPYVSELRSLEDLAVLSAPEVSESVKYLARIEGKAALGPLEEPCYFQNMNRYPWHLQFLQSFMALRGATLDGYLSWVLRPATRRMWGGSVQSWPDIEHPESGERGVITFDVYADPGGLGLEDIASADQQLEGCMAFARERLVFLPRGAEQEGLVRRLGDELAERGVATLLPSDLPRVLEQENDR